MGIALIDPNTNKNINPIKSNDPANEKLGTPGFSPYPSSSHLNRPAKLAAEAFFGTVSSELKLPDTRSTKSVDDNLPNFAFDETIPPQFETGLREGLGSHFLAPVYDKPITVTTLENLPKMGITIDPDNDFPREQGKSYPYRLITDVEPGVFNEHPLVPPPQNDILAIDSQLMGDLVNDTGSLGFRDPYGDFASWDMPLFTEAMSVSLGLTLSGNRSDESGSHPRMDEFINWANTDHNPNSPYNFPGSSVGLPGSSSAEHEPLGVDPKKPLGIVGPPPKVQLLPPQIDNESMTTSDDYSIKSYKDGAYNDNSLERLGAEQARHEEVLNRPIDRFPEDTSLLSSISSWFD